MSWHVMRSFKDSDHQAYMRFWDPASCCFRFRTLTCSALNREMRKRDRWYVAGWKIHLSIYPADYARALPALRLFEDRVAPAGLVYKYAASKGLYEAFEGEVKGKFATIYCTTPDEIPPILHLTNQLFTQEGITPVARSRIDELDGLRHELPLIGGYGFVRYGAFCYTNGLLDLTDPSREPIRDDRHLPFPRFRDPARLAAEIDLFNDLILPIR